MQAGRISADQTLGDVLEALTGMNTHGEVTTGTATDTPLLILEAAIAHRSSVASVFGFEDEKEKPDAWEEVHTVIVLRLEGRGWRA